MRQKRFWLILCSVIFLASCWDFNRKNIPPPDNQPKVLGYKPVYGAEVFAKDILYSATALPVINGGNIYAFQNYLFQVENGYGIHVIDNTNPSNAARIGFITVKGCSQMSIKNDKLYTNSYDDLIVLDFSNLSNIQIVSRLKGIFQEYRYGSPIAEPPVSGYYECPRTDSFVVKWIRDSVNQYCYKQ
ncbi:MAG TPA: hypothetical protein PKG90_05870 [Chitinophagaceae bacterium]|nr:hypothetical protein [Chitinophagaceae bacterium]HNU15853.1 hypothetical protein [Chitinophagaceae bacterium]